MDNPTKCKIVLLGDQSVGKTSVINRFIFDNFTGNEQPTVGVDFVSKTVNIENHVLRMQLWDTAGQQRFHSLIPSYIKDCTAAIIVFDLTNPASFDNLTKWTESVKQIRGQQALILVLANKCDLKNERTVQKGLMDQKIKELNLKCFQVSAKTGEGIADFFKQLAETITFGSKKRQTKDHKPSVEQTNVRKEAPVINITNKSQIEADKKMRKKGCC